MHAEDLPEDWVQQFLASERASGGVTYHLLAQLLRERGRGANWVRGIVGRTELSDHVRVAACWVLRDGNDASTVAAASSILISSADPWSRLDAAEALRGPWATSAVHALEKALADTRILTDWGMAYRVSDAAALSLHAVGTAETRVVLGSWRIRMEADLSSQDAQARELAVYVLARMGHGGALTILREFAKHPDADQARRVQYELDQPGDAGKSDRR